MSDEDISADVTVIVDDAVPHASVTVDGAPEITVLVDDATPSATAIAPDVAVVTSVALAAGEPGPVGPQGPPGVPGEGAAYRYVQDVPAAVWSIPHNLGHYPNVATFVNAGTLVEARGAVVHTDENTVTITFAMPVTGEAYLS